MIIAASVILGAVIIGAILVATYWNKIVDFMKRVLTKLKQVVKGTIMGSAVFLKNLATNFRIELNTIPKMNRENGKKLLLVMSRMQMKFQKSTVSMLVSTTKLI